MLPFELGRFARLHNTMMFLKDRVEEVVGWQYRLRYPLVNEFRTGRRIRTSPLFGMYLEPTVRVIHDMYIHSSPVITNHLGEGKKFVIGGKYFELLF